ncbi:MAG: hypothetical protein AAGA03_17370 [Planctomycetota bacterium]
MSSSKSIKSICKLSKERLSDVLPELAAESLHYPYICRKSGPIAASKKRLCKPVAIEKLLVGRVNDGLDRS